MKFDPVPVFLLAVVGMFLAMIFFVIYGEQQQKMACIEKRGTFANGLCLFAD